MKNIGFVIGFFLAFGLSCLAEIVATDCAPFLTKGVTVGEGTRNRLKIDIQLDRSAEVSFLFYKGELPAEDKQKALLDAWRIVCVKNTKTGVVAMFSLKGELHAEMKRFVPPGSELLGGTRYTMKEDGTIERKNSITFKELRGLAQDAANFEIRIH